MSRPRTKIPDSDGYITRSAGHGRTQKVKYETYRRSVEATNARTIYNRTKLKKKLLKDINNTTCQLCGIYNMPPCCYDFHHICGKAGNISNMITGVAAPGSTRAEALSKEIDKTMVLCRNCHMLLHKFGYDEALRLANIKYQHRKRAADMLESKGGHMTNFTNPKENLQ